jgi:hypothetical protein
MYLKLEVLKSFGHRVDNAILASKDLKSKSKNVLVFTLM